MVMAKNAKVITFASTKGGTSKTTTAFNFAVYEALCGRKVLLVDLDYQHDTTMMFNHVDKIALRRASIYRGFVHDSKNPQTAFPGDFKPVMVDKRIDLLSGSSQLDQVDNLMAQRKNLASFVLMHIIYSLKLYRQYDFIICDCHNSFGTCTLNGLIVADDIITPTIPNLFSINAITSMIDKLRSLKRAFYDVKTGQSDINAKLFFVGSMIKFNTKSSHEFEKAIQNNPKFIAGFKFRELINKSINNHQSVFTYAKNNSYNEKVVHDEIIPEFVKMNQAIR